MGRTMNVLVKRLLLLAAMAIAGMPSHGMATVYECKTQQVAWWHDGKIEPYIESPGRKAEKNAIIKFDDNSGEMDWQFDSNSRVVAQKFEVLKRQAQYNEVVAIQRYEDKKSSFASVVLFQIYADKVPNSASFIFYGTAGGRQISSGTCLVSDKLGHLNPPPPPVPQN